MIRFDKEQRSAVHAETNAVITAGAGSGKTSVLAERFCWLLEHHGADVEEILTLTFTQKAAAEMYERIYDRLLHAPPALRRHIEGFDNASICTMDSFCAEVLGNTKDLFGLPGSYRYDEESVARLAEATGLDFLLENLQHPALQTLLRTRGFEALWKNLFADLARNHLHLPGEIDFAAMAGRQIEYCRSDLEQLLGQALSLRAEICSIDPRTDSIRRAQETLGGFASIDRLLREGKFAEAGKFLTDLTLEKPRGRGGEDIRCLKQLIDSARNVFQKMVLLTATLAEERTLDQLFSLLDAFNKRFMEKKRSLGVVGFQDVAQMAVSALIRNKPLRQYYKNKYRYIMIDEFQDNNQLQKDLLYLLAEKTDLCNDPLPGPEDLSADKLFFVGDEKQSIYAFRGADVSVFKTLHSELERIGGRTIALHSNYRSESGLIQFFNDVFSSVFAGASAGFEARFQKMNKGGSDGSSAAQVHLFYGSHDADPAPEQTLATPAFSEAYSVVSFIHDTVERQSLTVYDGPEARPATYEDFAVILRSTSNQIHYERILRHFDIPYTTENLRSLFVEAPANDLYLLLQLALYPEDRAAYAGLLRSPFVNVSDETTIRLLLASRPGGSPPGGKSFGEPFDGIEDERIRGEDRSRLLNGRGIYTFVREMADRIPTAELIHHLWYTYGYRYTILRNPQNHNYLEHYDYLVKLAERFDRRGDTLVVFLDYLRRNLGRYERLEDLQILRNAARGIQLLTIHRSKGLEFPIVVLGDMGNTGRREQHSKPYYVSSKFGITIDVGADNYFTQISREETQAKELAEIKRLLYVALTRARYHVVLAGTHRSRNRQSPRAHLNLVLAALGMSEDTVLRSSPDPSASYKLKVHRIDPLPWESWLEHRASGFRSKPQAIEQLDTLYQDQPIRRRASRREISVTELCRHLDPIMQKKREDSGEVIRSRKLPELEVDCLLAEQNLERSFGILTHHLLELWSRDPTTPPPDPDWSRMGIPVQHRAQLLAGAVQLCRGFFDSELGALAAGAGRLDRELAFLHLFSNGQRTLYINGQIDLVFENGMELYLVDFKTDSSYRSGEHEGQLGLYTLAMKGLTEKKILACLFMLRSAEAIFYPERADWSELLKAISD